MSADHSGRMMTPCTPVSREASAAGWTGVDGASGWFERQSAGAVIGRSFRAVMNECRCEAIQIAPADAHAGALKRAPGSERPRNFPGGFHGPKPMRQRTEDRRTPATSREAWVTLSRSSATPSSGTGRGCPDSSTGAMVSEGGRARPVPASEGVGMFAGEEAGVGEATRRGTCASTLGVSAGITRVLCGKLVGDWISAD